MQVAYAIGVADPVSIRVETNGTAREGLTDGRLAEIVTEAVDLRPRAIIERLGLLAPDAETRPTYRDTAAYGHFGRDAFPWERLDLVDAFQKAAGVTA